MTPDLLSFVILGFMLWVFYGVSHRYTKFEKLSIRDEWSTGQKFLATVLCGPLVWVIETAGLVCVFVIWLWGIGLRSLVWLLVVIPFSAIGRWIWKQFGKWK